VRGYNRRWADAEFGKPITATRIAAAAILVICGNLTSKAFIAGNNKPQFVGWPTTGRTKNWPKPQKTRLVAILTQSHLVPAHDEKSWSLNRLLL
jgi:hypothetical protein